MRKIFLILFVFLLLIPQQGFAMDLSAQSAILVEAETGRVIYSKNCKNKMGMASTTKIMTALVALDKYTPGELATVSDKASRTEGSSVYLKSGEKMTVENLLYGLMLASGNDASVVIAEHLAGNEYTFVEYMNNKAISLGLNDTHFENPNGLPCDRHYTTAYDLAMITREAMKNKTFREIVSTKNKVLKSSSGENDRYIKNHNKLLWQYEGCVGVKTGFTKKDGRCLVSAAYKNGITLIAVTLKAPDDWNDHKKLFDYGFDRLSVKKVITGGKKAGNVVVNNGIFKSSECIYAEDFIISVEENDITEIKVFLPKSIDAPVKNGDTAGYARVLINGKTAGEVEIIVNTDVDLTDKTRLIRQFINLLIRLIR